MDNNQYLLLATLANIVELTVSSIKKASGSDLADIPEEELSELVAARLHKKVMEKAGGVQ